MEWVNSWIQGIIIAVIISTIIEMILPQGNCKKYIKVVIGVYILFTIVSPVITKLSGNNFSLSNIIDLDEYVQASSSNTQEELEANQEEQIKNIYIDSLKNDMTEKIKSKGYEIISIYLEIADDEQYTLKQIDLKKKKIGNDSGEQEQEDSSMVNQIAAVNEVEIKVESEGTTSKTGNTANSNNSIQLDNDTNSDNENQSENNSNSSNMEQLESNAENIQSENNTDKKNNLSTKEQNELKEYLSGVYEIEKENIHIN